MRNSLFTLSLKLQKNNLKMMAVIMLMLTVAISIQNTVSLILNNNKSFYQSQIGAAQETDIYIYFQRFDGNQLELTGKANQVIGELEQLNIPVEKQQFTYDSIKSQTAKRMLVFFSKTIASGSCILNQTASRILQVQAGDEVKSSSLNANFVVQSIEPTSEILQNAFQLGVITISDQYLIEYQKLQNNGGLADSINLRVKIDGSGENYSQLYQKVLEGVNPHFATESDANSVTVISPADNYHSGTFISDTVETLLGILSVISILITMIAMLSFFKLYEIQKEKMFCTLRTFGMLKKHRYYFAAYESIIIVLIVSIFSGLLGYFLFKTISYSIMGVAPEISFLSSEMLLTVFKSFLLAFVVVFTCKMWTYSKIFAVPIAVIFQGVPPSRRKLKTFIWPITGAILTLALTALYLSNVTLILYVLLFSLIILLIYVTITVFYAIFNKFDINLRSITTLALLLAQRKKRAFKLFGIVISVIIVFFTSLYLIEYGIDYNLQSYWVSTSNANVFLTVPTNEQAQLEATLKKQSLKYYISYTKIYDHENDPRVYRVGLINDPYELVPNLIPKPKHYYALPYFQYRENVKTGEEFKFPIGINASLSKILPKAPEFPGSFTVSINYQEAKHLIDNSFAVNYLLNINSKQLKQLIPLLPANVQISTASDAIKSLKLTFADYINLAIISCLLICIVLLLFLYFICKSAAILRKKEFAIYRVHGVGFSKLLQINVSENIFVGIIGAAAAFSLIYVLVNALLYLVLQNTAYSIPSPIMLAITLISSLLIVFSSFISIKATYKNLINVLKCD